MENKQVFDDTNRVFNAADMEPWLRDIILSAIMFFPESGEERQKYFIKATLIKAASEESAGNIDKSSPSFKTWQNEIGALFSGLIIMFGGWQNAANALLCGQQPDFYSNVRTVSRKGSIAGWVLDLALGYKSSVQKAAGSYCEVYQEGNGHIDKFYDVSPSFDVNEENIANNIWPVFKNVAHLWAACSHFSSTRNPDSAWFYYEFDSCVPDSPMDIPGGYEGFCLVAEKYRTEGIKFKPSRSGKSLLAQDKSWRIISPPSDFQIVD